MPPELITKFERGTLDTANFHHAQHLEVALWYALHYPPAEALGRMRDGLHRLLARAGRPEAYSEATTAYWMDRTQRFMSAADRTQSFDQLRAALLTETAGEPHQPDRKP